MSDEFLAHVGSRDIHDAVILRVETTQQSVTVFLKAYEGRHFAVRFYGVSSYEAQDAEGMMLYALTEMSGASPLHKFLFLNWDEEDPAQLEIVAEGFEMLDTVPHAAKD
jgi:hypothetical protein